MSRLALPALIAVAAATQFASAALRHAAFHSTVFDLGIFDQALFLLSRGETPHSSVLGFHILGDHGALLLYPLSLLYALHASPYWLLAAQAVGVSLGAWPLHRMALAAGLEARDGLLIAAAYLLYPVVYNQSVNDFHPEAFVAPALLGAAWSARARRPACFAACLALALACKEMIALTVAAMGVWLWLAEDRRRFGVAALLVGTGWFALVALVLIPWITGVDAARSIGDGRYGSLGDSIAAIAANVVADPTILAREAVSWSGLFYLVNLALPVLWGLTPRHLAPLLGAAPTIALNLLSSWSRQRSLNTQYSLPAVPFLLLAALGALAARHTWIRDRRAMLAWSAIAFLVFARYPRLARYGGALEAAPAARAALALVPADAAVLTDNCLGAHLAHRRTLHLLGFAVTPQSPAVPAEVDYVVFDAARACSVDAAWLARWRASLAEEFRSVRDEGGVVVLRRSR